MSSYLSSLLTTTTSRYNSLRRTLLSDENDGDTEDDTHICRVLRAYYTEKDRPFPSWLPPDPKAPKSSTAQFVSSNRMQLQQQASYSSRQQPTSQQSQFVSSGGLSDLWDPAPSQQLAPPQGGPSSLRKGGLARVRGEQSYSSSSGSVDPYSRQGSQTHGRPLPSQRAGSYQSQHSFHSQSDSYDSINSSQARTTSSSTSVASPPVTPAASSAQERLKARLWGNSGSSNNLSGLAGNTARSNSPVPSVSSVKSASNSPRYDRFGSRATYERGDSYASGGGSNSAYGSQSSSGYGSGGNYGRPALNSTASTPHGGYGAPDGYQSSSNAAGGGYGGSRYAGRERPGLPSGPRTYR